MSVNWLTFRIEEIVVDGESSGQRRKALYEYIENCSTNWWLEPTSFIVFDTDVGIDQLVAGCKNVISDDHDLVLIRAMDTKSARACGVINDGDIFEMMDYLKHI